MIPFSTILKLSGFPVEEAKTLFKQALSADKASWQDEKRWEIFKFHYQNNDFYRNFVGKEITDWKDIPVIRGKDLIGNYLSKMPAQTNPKKLYKSSTSGSTGTPLVFARDPLTHALVWENVRFLYNQAGITLDDRQARIFGMSKKLTGKVKARIKDMFSNRYRFDVFDLSDEALAKWVQLFKNEKFKYIYGYTNTLVVFAKYLINHNQTLKSVASLLKCCIITSEVCSEKDAQLLRKGFGIPVFNEYGSSELGIMGFKEFDYWKTSDELLFYEVLDENDNILPDGETGLLTCTSFFNKATPFIRYQLGDLASIRKSDGQTIIIEIMGRLNDLAILPSGRKTPGLSFYFVAQDQQEALQNIKEYIFRQTTEGFNFEYISDNQISDEDFNKIKKSVIRHLGEEINLSSVKVEKLERGKSGKFKQFISSI
jgi:phenylacetate-CoA ligase